MSYKVFIVACMLGSAIGRTVVNLDNNVTPDNQDAPKVSVGGQGVSASFGGYHASAGLGGLLGGPSGAGGGLYARAGTPDGTGASAGLGGALNGGGDAQGGLHAGAKVGSSSSSGGGAAPTRGGAVITTKHTSATLYNDIFNIPTSILGAVNRLLNGGGSAHVGTGGVSAGAGAGAGAGLGGGSNVATRTNAGAYAHAGTSGGAVGTGQSGGFFNDIFNIPITALNAVNQLLNNNPKNGK